MLPTKEWSRRLPSRKRNQSVYKNRLSLVLDYVLIYICLIIEKNNNCLQVCIERFALSILYSKV